MTFDALRPLASKVIEPMAKSFVRNKISPNALSLVSLLCAFLAGLCFFYSGSIPEFTLFAGIFVVLNSVLDALDGEVARMSRKASLKGDFLDHIIDRYADVFIICGIFFAGYVPWQIGVIAIVGVLLTSYLGTQAQALNLGRYYGGIMGRADRLVVIMLSAFANFAYPAKIASFSILGWAILLIAFTSHITALQRIFYIWNQLEE
ncbi:MAG: archaetidylinositol phosphate synthase [Methanosarcinaceae archaeon]|nr:archaetidylinositol phosphate synthase [Methanosarcinaceae archaeon]